MITTMTDDTRIHGIDTQYGADGGVVVRYVYPGSIGIGGTQRRIELGTCHADPDEQDPREDRFWAWEPGTRPQTRIWARHVLAADAAFVRAAGPRNLVYEHAGEVVLVWGFVPARADELALLAAGFRPALATWRAPVSAGAHSIAARMAGRMPATDGATTFGMAPPLAPKIVLGEQEELVEHAWMRWAALMDTRKLRLGQDGYDFLGPPQREHTRLTLRYRHKKDDLRVVFDVDRHPLIHDVTVSVGAQGDARHLGAVRAEQSFPGVAWEDLPRLVQEIQHITAPPVQAQPTRAKSAGKKRKSAAAPPSAAATASWVDAVLDHFNADPGPRLALQRTRAHGAVFVLHTEGGSRERALASIDVHDEEIEAVRWIDATIRSSQQEELLGRIERAIAAAADAPEGGRPSPLDELIVMMRRRGLVQLGVDPDATGKLDRTDGYRPLAEALRDLAEPDGLTPADLQNYLERAGLMAAAEVVGQVTGADPPPLRGLMQALWAELDEAMPLHKVVRGGPLFSVPPECLFEEKLLKGQARPRTVLLVAGPRPQMIPRRVRVRVVEPPEEHEQTDAPSQVMVEDPTDSIAAGDALHLGGYALDQVVIDGDPLEFIIKLSGKVREFEATLARAPQALEDVRRLLYWSAAMLDAPRCQGELKEATHRSFQLARSYYETARKRLIEGRTGDAVRQMHEALRRISSSAAELAMNCAEGQLTLTPPGTIALVSPEDAAALS